MPNKFGIEIEFLSCNGYTELYKDLKDSFSISMNDDYIYDWVFKSDGSVEDDFNPDSWGIEIVSRPMSLNNHSFNKIRQLCAELNEYTTFVNETCGLHVHIDADFLCDFSVRQQRAFFKHIRNLYSKFEKDFDSRMEQSRRNNNNTYCQSMNANQIDYDNCRYVKLNTCSFIQHGTIEFRHHHGTLDADEIINWVKTCFLFMEFAIKTFLEVERKVFESNFSLSDQDAFNIIINDFSSNL